MKNSPCPIPRENPYRGSVLVVDDDPVMQELIVEDLGSAGYHVCGVGNFKEMWQRLGARSYDVALIDLFLEEEGDTMSIFPTLLREFPYTKVIAMSAQGTVEVVADAIDQGAATFVNKTEDPKLLLENLKERLASHLISDECSDLPDGECLGIIGESDSVKELLSKVQHIKSIDSTVLLTGESGTGKELVARAIHRTSTRQGRRFDALNCGAIPGNLLESELFGHKKGAFTDAKADRKGLFELCSQGTLFLDEVAELPLNLQVKLLRVLQEMEVTPVGGSEKIQVETRIVAATNKDLALEVKNGNFREDLFYRLAVLHMEITPLRDRKDDIPCLSEYYLKKFNKRFNKKVRTPSSELLARLTAYDWPGNIRELKNAIERGVVLAKGDEMVIEDMLEKSLMPHAGNESTVASKATDSFWTEPLSEAKQGFEQAYLKHLLELTRGNISEIARISGRYRTDVYRLLTKHGVDWEEFRPN